MQTIRLRLTGTETDADALMNAIHALDGIEHVEEVDDLMPHGDDDDSSSSGLSEDLGPGLHDIEIEAPNARFATRVRDVADAVAEDRGIAIEFVDEF